jgi:hypothetical protein
MDVRFFPLTGSVWVAGVIMVHDVVTGAGLLAIGVFVSLRILEFFIVYDRTKIGLPRFGRPG